MKSFPSTAESLDKELDRYEKEYDQKPLDRQKSYLQPAFIQVFPEQARAKIKGEIEETETRLAESAANSVLSEVLWDRHSPEKAPREPHWVPRRKPPTPNGLEELVRSVQSIIKHYSSVKIERVVLRKLLGDVFEAASRGDEITESENHVKLIHAVRDAILKHWMTDKTFFGTILRPAAGYGVDMEFWQKFLLHGFLLRRLRMAEDQPQEATGLEPQLIEVLKFRGHVPVDFFKADPSTQEIWIAEARKRYDRTQASLVEASPTKPATPGDARPQSDQQDGENPLLADEPSAQDYWNISRKDYIQLVQQCRESKAPLEKELHKHRFQDFKEIMHQLCVEPNFFVTLESYQNAELIFESHFTDPKQPTDPAHRIEWIGTGPAYRNFHKRLLQTERITNKEHASFFAAHFIRKGKSGQSKVKIRAWTRDRAKNTAEPSENAKKLEEIVPG